MIDYYHKNNMNGKIFSFVRFGIFLCSRLTEHTRSTNKIYSYFVKWGTRENCTPKIRKYSIL